jgi:hypothetical protein
MRFPMLVVNVDTGPPSGSVRLAFQPRWLMIAGRRRRHTLVRRPSDC